MEWVSIKDEKPALYVAVLVYSTTGADGEGIYIAEMTDSDSWLTKGGWSLKNDSITHWQPLPVSPMITSTP